MTETGRGDEFPTDWWHLPILFGLLVGFGWIYVPSAFSRRDWGYLAGVVGAWAVSIGVFIGLWTIVERGYVDPVFESIHRWIGQAAAAVRAAIESVDPLAAGALLIVVGGGLFACSIVTYYRDGDSNE